MKPQIYADAVPPVGPLSLASVYSRAELNARFGGNRFSGIVPSPKEPVILLFHTKEPTQQFYKDGFDSEGLYWYSAEGSLGNMNWTAANRAIRDHAALGRDLFFFERVQRKGGLWQFAHIFQYFCHKEERRKDRDGNERTAIIFGLLPITNAAGVGIALEAQQTSLANLRLAASAETDPAKVGVRTAIRNVRVRSEAVKQYALARAKGQCEACNQPAPFNGVGGHPFLEVHHIDRLADDGEDKIESVAAICPNCHRRCHYASDRAMYNSMVRTKIAALEEKMSASAI